MRNIFFGKSRKILVKEEIIREASLAFSQIALDTRKRDLKDDYVWVVAAKFYRDVTLAKTEEQIAAAKNLIENKKEFRKHVEEKRKEEASNYKEMLKSAIDGLDKKIVSLQAKNEILNAQNIELLNRNEALEVQGIKASKQSVRLFGLSIIASTIIAITPFVAKKMGYDFDAPDKPVTMAQPKDIICHRQKIIICDSCHFTNPIASGDGKKNDNSPSINKNDIPDLKPQGKKVRSVGFTPK